MEDLDDFLEFMDMAEVANIRIPKRYIRDYSNLLNSSMKKHLKNALN